MQSSVLLSAGCILADLCYRLKRPSHTITIYVQLETRDGSFGSFDSELTAMCLSILTA